MQQAFGGTFPFALIVAHLDQLAGEWHIIHVQTQRRTQRRANPDLLVIDVAASALEAVDLGAQLFVFLPALTQGHAVLGERVLQIGIVPERLFAPGLIFATLRGEGGDIGRYWFVQNGCQFPVAPGLGLARITQLFFPANLGGKTLQAVATVVIDGLLEFIELVALLLVSSVQFLCQGIHAFPFFSQQSQSLVDQAEL